MTEPTRDPPRDSAAAYVLGALAAEEAREFEAFLARSPEAQREVAELREVAALLAVGAGGPAPGPDVRDRVLARIGSGRGVSPPDTGRTRWSPLLWGALAASLLAVVGVGIGAVAMRRQLDGLRAALAESHQRLGEAQQRLAARESTLTAIFEPGVEMFQLTSTGDPDPRIQLFWDRERHRAILHGIRLARPPSGRAYQLWFIRDGAPVPSVTFTPGPSGQVQVENVEVPAGGTVSAAAVTVEPSAGSAQPTSPIVLVGSLGKAE